jgi:hypothetical protein
MLGASAKRRGKPLKRLGFYESSKKHLPNRIARPILSGTGERKPVTTEHQQ